LSDTPDKNGWLNKPAIQRVNYPPYNFPDNKNLQTKLTLTLDKSSNQLHSQIVKDHS